MPPSQSPLNGTSAARASPEAGDEIARVADSDSKNPGLRNSLQRREPARRATGLPDSVPAWYTGPERRQMLHDVAPPAEGADRHAAADHLAERGEVGRLDAVERLRAAAARRGSRSSPRRKSAARRARVHSSRSACRNPAAGAHEIHVAGDRLDDHAAMSSPCIANASSSCCDVVVVEHHRVLRDFRRHAGARSGLPKVAAPEPALTSSESAWP